MFALKSSELDVFWLRYLLTASDFHLPIVLMSSTAMPAATAELAAPRRKEWPEYVVVSYPARRRELVMLSASQRWLNALPPRGEDCVGSARRKRRGGTGIARLPCPRRFPGDQVRRRTLPWSSQWLPWGWCRWPGPAGSPTRCSASTSRPGTRYWRRCSSRGAREARPAVRCSSA